MWPKHINNHCGTLENVRLGGSQILHYIQIAKSLLLKPTSVFSFTFFSSLLSACLFLHRTTEAKLFRSYWGMLVPQISHFISENANKRFKSGCSEVLVWQWGDLLLSPTVRNQNGLTQSSPPTRQQTICFILEKIYSIWSLYFTYISNILHLWRHDRNHDYNSLYLPGF